MSGTAFIRSSSRCGTSVCKWIYLSDELVDQTDTNNDFCLGRSKPISNDLACLWTRFIRRVDISYQSWLARCLSGVDVGSMVVVFCQLTTCSSSLHAVDSTQSCFKRRPVASQSNLQRWWWWWYIIVYSSSLRVIQLAKWSEKGPEKSESKLADNILFECKSFFKSRLFMARELQKNIHRPKLYHPDTGYNSLWNSQFSAFSVTNLQRGIPSLTDGDSSLIVKRFKYRRKTLMF